MIKGFVIGFVLAVVVLAAGIYCYFAAGMAPVATADPPMPFERKLANMALDAHIEKQHVAQSLVAADEPNFLSGAHVYKRHCAACHGLPGSDNVSKAAAAIQGQGCDR
jgi:mono/diheme cytochrome c family protein